MEIDPMREIRAIRRKISVECGNDADRVFDYYQMRQDQLKASGKFTFVTRPLVGVPAGLATDGSVVVTVPEDSNEEEQATSPQSSDRESIRIQADLCRIGEAMGFKIWLPAADRTRVADHWTPQPGALLDRLPLNYDETTLDTIKRIDVLWLKGRSITRAFEVEHTTAIYSGILRMADLCALLPNINVSLHLVAPESRRDKVFQEITRPVFSLLEHTPLSERCTYLSYGSIHELVDLQYLSHTTDTVLDEFVEYAE